MTDRILDITEAAARLRVRDAQLVVEREGAPEARIPLEDLAAVIVNHHGVMLTQPAMAALAAAGVSVLVCDGGHAPVGMLTPLVGHSVQTERIAAQVGASLPTRKRLWQALVRAKIAAQAEVARRTLGDELGLTALARRVRSGDAGGHEAQAARRYWAVLFQPHAFHRRRDGPPPNGLLNYGYAVLRAAVARAVCAAGLHPSVGLHHHNRYDAFCLADDLMEPLRPVVDEVVVEIVGTYGIDAEPTPPVKRMLLEALTGPVALDGERRTLFDAAARLAVSLAEALAGRRRTLAIPTLDGRHDGTQER